MQFPPLLVQVKAHISSSSLPAHLNCLADFIASHSQHNYSSLPPSLPMPTFHMDTFALSSTSTLRYVKNNAFPLVICRKQCFPFVGQSSLKLTAHQFQTLP